MSKGPGRVQRAILALIEAEPHGAWTTADLCRLIYADDRPLTKARRVAVLRDLHKLPGTWEGRRMLSAQSGEYCLFDPCDNESYAHKVYLEDRWRKRSQSYEHWRQAQAGNRVKTAFGSAAQARKWRDASPIERLDIEIGRERQMLAFIEDDDAKREAFQRIAALIAERDRLKG